MRGLDAGHLLPRACHRGAALRTWARDKLDRPLDARGPDTHNVLLGAYPHDPQWESATGASSTGTRPAAEGCPQGSRLTTAAYGGTGTSRDTSADNETTG